MSQPYTIELQKLGFSATEAESYLALVNHGPLGATAIANLIGVPRSSVYPTLSCLIARGLIEAGTGYGSTFTAVPPAKALPSLILREKETLSQRERITDQLVDTMGSVTPSEE